jgi:hypothetical protein
MLEGSSREAPDAKRSGARLQRIDPWIIVDNFHRHITVSDGELGRERAPSRRYAQRAGNYADLFR